MLLFASSKELQLQILEGAVSNATTVSNRGVTTVLAVATETRDRVEDGSMYQVFPVQRPVPIPKDVPQSCKRCRVYTRLTPDDLCRNSFPSKPSRIDE